MYEDSEMLVRSVWIGFKVGVGLHEGSALSPYLFAMVMHRLTDAVRQASPWTMMFAGNTVIVGSR